MPYMILIKKSPEGHYQSYVGWDTIYADKQAAIKAKKRADAKFMRVKIIKLK